MKRNHLLSLLLSPDADSGGGSDQAPSNPSESAPPPGAEIVLNSDVKESDAAEIVRLKRELDEEKAGRKKDQTRLSELEDENHRLKQPVPVPVKKKEPTEEPKPEKRNARPNTFFG